MSFDQAIVNLAYRCNNRCRFCLHGAKRDEVAPADTDACKAMLQRAREASERLLLTGGEPTIRPDYLELLQAAKDLQFASVSVQTNGRMFAYKPFAQKAAAVPTQYIVAVQGHLKEAHDYLTQIHDSFKQTLSGLQNLKAARLPFSLATALHRSNYRHVVAIATLAQRLEAAGVRLIFPAPEGAMLDDYIRQAPRFALLEPYLRQVADLTAEAGLDMEVEGMPFCFLKGLEDHAAEARRPRILILANDGETESTPETRRQQKQEQPDQCSLCGERPRCEGVWKAYVEHYGWAESEFGDDTDIMELPYGRSASS